MSALDVQISGDHYKCMKIQPVEFITANNIPFLEGNVIKYVCRHMSKNGLSDIDKAIHCANKVACINKGLCFYGSSLEFDATHAGARHLWYYTG